MPDETFKAVAIVCAEEGEKYDGLSASKVTNTINNRCGLYPHFKKERKYLCINKNI